MKNDDVALYSDKKYKFLFGGSIAVLVILLIVLLLVMVAPPEIKLHDLNATLLAILLVKATHLDTSIFIYLTGEKSKLELIKLIGWGISGVIAILGVMALFYRAETLDKQNETIKKGYDKQAAASDKQNKIIRDGQRHERIKTANERLASKDTLVRIASFNDFYYLASIELDLRRYILNILCEHLQQIIKDKNNRKDINAHEKIEPTNEEQRLLNILFKNDSVFDSNYANLAGINLQNVNLQGANLQGANLQDAELEDANLQSANLQSANLQNAKLRSANLRSANLQGANFLGADLQVAHLQNANMQDVELHNAKLRSANLRGANLQKANMLCAHLENANLEKANLQKADLQGAKLKEVNLQGAELQEADLKRADLQDASLQGAKLQEVNLQAAKLHRADLQWAELQGADLRGADLQGAKLQRAYLTGAIINKNTIMPDNWENIVERDNDGKTGVIEED